MALSITILQPASLTATVDGGSILAAVVGASANLQIDVGVPGAAATVQVGTTTTGDAGTDASVVNVGTTSAAILDFTIPRGDKGEQGDQGPKGDTGATGPKGDKGDTGATGAGVATGGSAGQVLAKIDGTNYNTEWIDVTSGGGTWGSITGTLSNQTDLQNALDGKLNLTGGTMSGSIYGSGSYNFNLIAYQATDGYDPILGSVKLGSANVFDNDYAFVGVTGDLQTLGLYANGNTFIKFGDGSTQASAYNPSVLNGYLPLTGGTVTGDVTIAGGANAVYFNITGDGGKSLSFGTDSDFNVTANDFGLIFDGSYGFQLTGSGNGITFPNNSVQQTAWLGYTGTTSQYIRGDGSLATYLPGDRYLTSSTTSLTISNGSKTLTIETGLSYSSQQDVTIAYDASNHMHATVTSYNSTTGVMVADVYNKTGSGTYSAWTVNVGGAVGGSYLQTANNLSELTATSSTARANLGLGSMATQSTSAYLSTSAAASTYLTISSAASTYQPISGMSSYLTTSSASTTYIAQSSYATTAQAQAGSSTTAVISASTLQDAKYFQGGKSAVQFTWSTSVSGTGASAGTQNANARLNIAPTTATGYAIASAVIANNSRGTIYNSGFDFSKRVQFGLRVARNVASPDTNSVWRFSIGKSSVTDASDLSARGLMIKVAGSGALQLLVHNGTTLTTTTSTFTPSNGVSYDVVVVSDGAGNVTLYVNGSSVATSTGGPTSAGSTNANVLMFEVQNTATISASPQNICVSDYYLQVNT